VAQDIQLGLLYVPFCYCYWTSRDGRNSSQNSSKSVNYYTRIQTPIDIDCRALEKIWS